LNFSSLLDFNKLNNDVEKMVSDSEEYNVKNKHIGRVKTLSPNDIIKNDKIFNLEGKKPKLEKIIQNKENLKSQNNENAMSDDELSDTFLD
jgi:hypothetical protein